MKKKVTKKRVVRKTEAVAARVVKVQSTGYDGDFEVFELTDKVLRDPKTSNNASWRRSLTFRDLAITLANLRNYKANNADVDYSQILGKHGREEYVAWGVTHDTDAQRLDIGCQTFTGKNYDRILKAVSKTGLYSV